MNSCRFLKTLSSSISLMSNSEKIIDKLFDESKWKIINLLLKSIINRVSCSLNIFNVKHFVLNKFISSLVQFTDGTLKEKFLIFFYLSNRFHDEPHDWQYRFLTIVAFSTYSARILNLVQHHHCPVDFQSRKIYFQLII